VTLCGTLRNTCNIPRHVPRRHTSTAMITDTHLQHTFSPAATHCITLHHTATLCNTPHTATHCNTPVTRCSTPQQTVTHRNTPHHTTAFCHKLHCTARHWNELYCTATHFATLQHTVTHLQHSVCCNALQHPVRCNTYDTLQVAATPCHT